MKQSSIGLVVATACNMCTCSVEAEIIEQLIPTACNMSFNCTHVISTLTVEAEITETDGSHCLQSLYT